jgi:hypothetical protein
VLEALPRLLIDERSRRRGPSPLALRQLAPSSLVEFREVARIAPSLGAT